MFGNTETTDSSGPLQFVPKRCSLSFNADLTEWDVGSVNEMTNMFSVARRIMRRIRERRIQIPTPQRHDPFPLGTGHAPLGGRGRIVIHAAHMGTQCRLIPAHLIRYIKVT